MTLLSQPPAGYREVSGEGFSIWAPSDFKESHRTSSNGEDMLVLEKPATGAGLPERVAVIRDVSPKSSADEQSFALEKAKAAGGPAGKAQRIELPAKDGQPAFLVQWVENAPSPSGGAAVPVQYWQLMNQASGDLILNVVSLAPAETFPTSEVSTILRTFTVKDNGKA